MEKSVYIIKIHGVDESILDEINMVINKLKDIEKIREYAGGINSNKEIYREFTVDKSNK